MIFLLNFLIYFSVPARIVNISKNVSVNEGENVNLYCLAVGRPEPTVTWKDQKCKLPLFCLLVLKSRDTMIAWLHLYLSIFRSISKPLLWVLFYPYQHAAQVHSLIPHSCVIILKPSCLVCPNLKFIAPHFPHVPMFCPKLPCIIHNYPHRTTCNHQHLSSSTLSTGISMPTNSHFWH